MNEKKPTHVDDMLRIPAIDAADVWVNQFAALTTNSKEKEPMMGEEYMCGHIHMFYITQVMAKDTITTSIWPISPSFHRRTQVTYFLLDQQEVVVLHCISDYKDSLS